MADKVHKAANKGNKLIAKYDKKNKEIGKFVSEVDLDDNEKGVYTTNKSVIIDGIKGMSSIELNFNNVEEDYEIEVNKGLLYETFGTESTNKLTYNAKAVEKVDVSGVTLKVKRDRVTKEIIKEVEIEKEVNRSKGIQRRRDILDGDTVVGEDDELFSNLKIEIDEDSINAGVYNNNILSKVDIFGNVINVKGDGILRYITGQSEYKFWSNYSYVYVFVLKVINSLPYLLYRKVEPDYSENNVYYYIVGNPVKDFGFSNSYFLSFVSPNVIDRYDSWEQKIKFYNGNDDLIFECQFHSDISIAQFTINENEQMLNGTYEVCLRNIDTYISGDTIKNYGDITYKNYKDLDSDILLKHNKEGYIISPPQPFDVMEKVKIQDYSSAHVVGLTIDGIYYKIDNFMYIPSVSGLSDYTTEQKNKYYYNLNNGTQREVIVYYAKYEDQYQEKVLRLYFKKISVGYQPNPTIPYLYSDYYFGDHPDEKDVYYIGYQEINNNNNIPENSVFSLWDYNYNIISNGNLRAKSNMENDQPYDIVLIVGDNWTAEIGKKLVNRYNYSSPKKIEFIVYQSDDEVDGVYNYDVDHTVEGLNPQSNRNDEYVIGTNYTINLSNEKCAGKSYNVGAVGKFGSYPQFGGDVLMLANFYYGPVDDLDSNASHDSYSVCYKSSTKEFYLYTNVANNEERRVIFNYRVLDIEDRVLYSGVIDHSFNQDDISIENKEKIALLFALENNTDVVVRDRNEIELENEHEP